MSQIRPFLTFKGQAEEAMNYYTAKFSNTEITSLQRFEAGMPGDVGKVMGGFLSLKGQEFQFLDMAAGNEVPDFSWAQSFYVECRTQAEFAEFLSLADDGGHIMMHQAPFMNFQTVAWVTDKYGVTWQPVLA